MERVWISGGTGKHKRSNCSIIAKILPTSPIAGVGRERGGGIGWLATLLSGVIQA